MTLADLYFDRIADLLSALHQTQAAAVEAAAESVAAAWASGGRVMVARTNHCLHSEAVFRAGGPIPIAALEEEGEEVQMGVGEFRDMRVDALPNLRANDVVLIHSNAGTTQKTVGIALLARQAGARTVALTQVPFETDDTLVTWHPSGHRLAEVCDVCIDLGGDVGDAALRLPKSGERIAPTSGVTGMVAMWALLARAGELMEQQGHRAYFLRSGQLPGAIPYNDQELRSWQETVRAGREPE